MVRLRTVQLLDLDSNQEPSRYTNPHISMKRGLSHLLIQILLELGVGLLVSEPSHLFWEWLRITIERIFHP